MSSIRNTKNRIKSVQITAKVTKAMKAIAAMRLRKYQVKAKQVERYAKSLLDSLNEVLSSIPSGSTPAILKGNPNGKILVVLVGPSRGFCGGLHRTCLSDTIKYFDSKGVDITNPEQVEMITINRPAKRLISKTGGKVVASFDGPYKDIDAYTVLPISELTSNLWQSNNYKSIYLSYASTNSAFKATVNVEQILPFAAKSLTPDLTPVNIDTDFDSLITELLPLVTQSVIHLGLLDTQTAEEGARMLAMNQATDNAKELEKKLQLIFFRQRQAKITQEIAEIVGGSL
jgi:F-type H+-transporting ATPase subunit gamma